MRCDLVHWSGIAGFQQLATTISMRTHAVVYAINGRICFVARDFCLGSASAYLADEYCECGCRRMANSRMVLRGQMVVSSYVGSRHCLAPALHILVRERVRAASVCPVGRFLCLCWKMPCKSVWWFKGIVQAVAIGETFGCGLKWVRKGFERFVCW